MNLKDPKNPSGPVTVKGMSVKVDRDLCIGAASCVAIAEDVFALDNESKAVVTNPKGADEGTIVLAAKSCPTRAISVFDENGDRIYP